MSRRPLVAAVALALAVGGLGACSSSSSSSTTPVITPGADVGVQLFQWTWDAIAAECTEVLGPAGVAWVLTSPPQEHIVGEAWWTAYQPVSYQVESRLGSREQFANMVSACDEAGVAVVADAVINHMTGQDSGVGWAGSEFEHYSYPGLYSFGDFHHCGLTPNDDIVDYTNAEQVQTCELVNLADLDTASEKVQDTIRAYLEDLLDLGVAGFRIDAAKHMAAADIEAIVGPLPEGTIIMQEVIGARAEPIQPSDYAEIGQVFDFYFTDHLTGAIKGENPGQVFRVDAANTGLTSAGAVVFVDNHDTERDRRGIAYRDDEQYQLAMVLLLASPYGTPVILSSYAFGNLGRDVGPNQTADGAVVDATCAAEVGPNADRAEGEWICQHRWDAVLGMVEWRHAAGEAPVTDLAEERGTVTLRRGETFFAANGTGSEASLDVETGLAAGEYCNLAAGPLLDGSCVGGAVTVDDDGAAHLALAPYGAVALAPDARPDAAG